MERYRTLWLTERGLRHQEDALRAAPPMLDVTVLRQPAPAELRSHLAEADFLVSERMGAIDAQMLALAPRLKLIVRLGSLVHDIDTAAAQARGITVTTWPVRSAIMVAEHALMQMLALAKRLREVNALAEAAGDWGPARRTDEDTFSYNWTRRAGIGGLWQQTIGILGFGEIGAELARHLRGWDCTVLYNRRRRLPESVEAELGVRFTAETLIQESDFLVNLLPYARETEGWLGAAQLARMKQGAVLVSCGSGGVIDEAALAAALREGHLAGAALDTYEWEPLRADNPLVVLARSDPAANVLLTPHTAAGARPRQSDPGRAEDYTPILRYLSGR